ncbi:hypothetical protein [Blastomonas sp.]|uniref:hypothetical protein n=1 Tax=Blastomonas sp. TaxID=1909299 RepID=UPI003593647E
MRLYSVLCVAAAFTLTACGGSDTTVMTDSDGNEVKVTKQGSDENTQIKIESADGSGTVNIGGAASNARLPFDFKPYPGAKVVSTMMGNSDGKSGGMIVMTSSGKRDDIVDFYRTAAEAKGFKIETEITSGEMRSIAGRKGESDTFSLQVTPSDGETSITLLAGEG